MIGQGIDNSPAATHNGRMNVLVTGGAGYVASHCVRALCDAAHHVTVLDNLHKGHQQAVDRRAEMSIGDLADVELLGRVFAKGRFEAVMHFAALAEVSESVREPLLYYRTNVTNSIALLEAMREHGVRTFVFSSSCAVYGVPPAVPITEDMPTAPISPYGRTKLAIEWALGDCAIAWGLQAIALRYFNAAGAAADGAIGEDHAPESHLVPRILQVALGKEREMLIFGDDYDTPDGTCIRDYVHVEDLAAAHRLAIEMPPSPRPTTASARPVGRFCAYNVGAGRGHSVMEVIAAAREVTGHPIPCSIGPRRAGDPPALYADSARIARQLGWSPRYAAIRDIVSSAWLWHRGHPHGFA